MKNFYKVNKVSKANMSKKYIFWMAVNSWATSTASVISVNSMLKSVNGITVTYVGKDILGQLGGLLYSWKTGVVADKSPKKYALIGTTLLQSAFVLDNISVWIVPEYTLPILGLSSMLKNIAFISIGAVNAHNMQKIGGEQIGELYTKIASVNTLSSTSGMLTGLFLIDKIPSQEIRSCCILPIFSVISLYSVKKACEI